MKMFNCKWLVIFSICVLLTLAAGSTYAQILPTVAFESNASSGLESVSSPVLTVILSEAYNAPVTVHYAVTGGNATGGGVDYTLIEGSIVFNSGETKKPITLDIVDDALVETNETIVITLSSPVNAVLGNIISHTYTIIDNDGTGAGSETISVEFSGSTSSGPENIGHASINLVLTRESSEVITVHYAVTGGTADKDNDFTTGNTVIFYPGETSKSIELDIINDDKDEPDETVELSLTDASNADIGDNSKHTYTIIDDDEVTVSFNKSTSSGQEDMSSVIIPVSLSAASEQTITVYYIVTGTARAYDDYLPPSGILSFEPGITSQNIEIEIIDDKDAEDTETIELTLTSSDNASIGDISTHTFSLNDNDQRMPDIVFSSNTSEVYEDVSTASIEVTLSSSSNKTVTVNYSLEGTASEGNDYKYIDNKTVIFEPGETSKKIDIDILDDSLNEPDETVVFTLSDPVNGKLGNDSVHTLWILDNDEQKQEVSLFKQEVATFDKKNKLTIIGSKILTMNLRGIAKDNYGNLYISDQGPQGGINEGAIYMWPKGRNHILKIIQGLTQPGDIELSPDQKSLIVAGPNGAVFQYPFGISIRLTNIDPTQGHTRVHVFDSVTGEMVAKVSPDGYFHFMGLLIPGQGPTVDVVVEHNGRTRHYVVPLGQPGFNGEPFGQTIINLAF